MSDLRLLHGLGQNRDEIRPTRVGLFYCFRVYRCFRQDGDVQGRHVWCQLVAENPCCDGFGGLEYCAEILEGVRCLAV